MNFIRMIGIVPLGVGVTLLGFLWLQPFGGFHSPPLVFRIFGSFVALGFILHGGAFLSGAVTDTDRLKSMARSLRGLQEELKEELGPMDQNSSGMVNYQCQACGAALSRNADVSPHGDVKCQHCGTWFNIHKNA